MRMTTCSTSVNFEHGEEGGGTDGISTEPPLPQPSKIKDPVPVAAALMQSFKRSRRVVLQCAMLTSSVTTHQYARASSGSDWKGSLRLGSCSLESSFMAVIGATASRVDWKNHAARRLRGRIPPIRYLWS